MIDLPQKSRQSPRIADSLRTSVIDNRASVYKQDIVVRETGEGGRRWSKRHREVFTVLPFLFSSPFPSSSFHLPFPFPFSFFTVLSSSSFSLSCQKVARRWISDYLCWFYAASQPFTAQNVAVTSLWNVGAWRPVPLADASESESWLRSPDTPRCALPSRLICGFRCLFASVFIHLSSRSFLESYYWGLMKFDVRIRTTPTTWKEVADRPESKKMKSKELWRSFKLGMEAKVSVRIKVETTYGQKHLSFRN